MPSNYNTPQDRQTEGSADLEEGTRGADNEVQEARATSPTRNEESSLDHDTNSRPSRPVLIQPARHIREVERTPQDNPYRRAYFHLTSTVASGGTSAQLLQEEEPAIRPTAGSASDRGFDENPTRLSSDGDAAAISRTSDDGARRPLRRKKAFSRETPSPVGDGGRDASHDKE